MVRITAGQVSSQLRYYWEDGGARLGLATVAAALSAQTVTTIFSSGLPAGHTGRRGRGSPLTALARLA